MFCSNCGTQMNDDAKFCSGCGGAVQRTVQSPQQSMTPPVQNNNPQQQQPVTQQNHNQQGIMKKPPEIEEPVKKKKGCINLFCAIFIGLLAGAMVMFPMAYIGIELFPSFFKGLDEVTSVGFKVLAGMIVYFAYYIGYSWVRNY